MLTVLHGGLYLMVFCLYPYSGLEDSMEGPDRHQLCFQTLRYFNLSVV